MKAIVVTDQAAGTAGMTQQQPQPSAPYCCAATPADGDSDVGIGEVSEHLMPIHEYDCEACGCRFEKIQHITRREADTADASVCPDCGATSVHRIVSTFMVNSGGVRQLNLRAGRRAAGKVAREKEQAQFDYLKSHEH